MSDRYIPREIDESERQFFAANGYAVLPNYLPAITCEGLQEELLSYLTESRAIEVELPHSKFCTANGHEVDTRFPQLGKLYDGELLQALRVFHEPLATISDRAVGLSINFTPPGGRFQAHFDRNVLTAVLYVNDGFSGGAMRVYPRLQSAASDGGRRTGSLRARLVQAWINRTGRHVPVVAHAVIKPQVGMLLVFEGSRSLHRVDPVMSGEPRLSVQFAYDVPGKRFNTDDYYGRRRDVANG